MGTILIVYDQGGIAHVEKDKSLFTIPKAAKTLADIAKKGGEGLNTIPIIIDASDIGVALLAVQKSDRLNPLQKEQFTSILLSYDPVLDSVKSKFEQGIFLRSGPVVDGGGPPTYKTGFKFVDP